MQCNKKQETRRNSSSISDKVDIKPTIRREKAHYVWMREITQQEVITAINAYVQISSTPDCIKLLDKKIINTALMGDINSLLSQMGRSTRQNQRRHFRDELNLQTSGPTRFLQSVPPTNRGHALLGGTRNFLQNSTRCQ